MMKVVFASSKDEIDNDAEVNYLIPFSIREPNQLGINYVPYNSAMNALEQFKSFVTQKQITEVSVVAYSNGAMAAALFLNKASIMYPNVIFSPIYHNPQIQVKCTEEMFLFATLIIIIEYYLAFDGLRLDEIVIMDWPLYEIYHSKSEVLAQLEYSTLRAKSLLESENKETGDLLDYISFVIEVNNQRADKLIGVSELSNFSPRFWSNTMLIKFALVVNKFVLHWLDIYKTIPNAAILETSTLVDSRFPKLIKFLSKAFEVIKPSVLSLEDAIALFYNLKLDKVLEACENPEIVSEEFLILKCLVYFHQEQNNLALKCLKGLKSTSQFIPFATIFKEFFTSQKMLDLNVSNLNTPLLTLMELALFRVGRITHIPGTGSSVSLFVGYINQLKNNDLDGLIASMNFMIDQNLINTRKEFVFDLISNILSLLMIKSVPSNKITNMALLSDWFVGCIKNTRSRYILCRVAHYLYMVFKQTKVLSLEYDPNTKMTRVQTTMDINALDEYKVPLALSTLLIQNVQTFHFRATFTLMDCIRHLSEPGSIECNFYWAEQGYIDRALLEALNDGEKKPLLFMALQSHVYSETSKIRFRKMFKAYCKDEDITNEINASTMDETKEVFMHSYDCGNILTNVYRMDTLKTIVVN